MRQAKITRKTTETSISCTLQLGASPSTEIDTGCGFLDHMLQLFARHGSFGIQLVCKGDTGVDDHHSTEDVGIVLGQAFAKALGNGGGIQRYASVTLPMDEALLMASVDVSGRCGLYSTLCFPTQKIGNFDTQLVEEFFAAFVRSAGITLHLRQICGENSHHIAEAAFKAFARALAQAVSIDEKAKGKIPSSKGLLL